jgi:hypothetical protein
VLGFDASKAFRLDPAADAIDHAFDSPRQTVKNISIPICQPTKRNIYNRPLVQNSIPTSSSSLLPHISSSARVTCSDAGPSLSISPSPTHISRTLPLA